jgi:TATA-box binding protein (TBP) (component of TFIID and TFIIIB)
MATVALLAKETETEQRERLALSQAYMSEFTDFSVDPGSDPEILRDALPPLNLILNEGAVERNDPYWRDPLGLCRATMHDVVPTEAECYVVPNPIPPVEPGVEEALQDAGILYPYPKREQIYVPPDLEVSVVNLVHTSYSREPVKNPQVTTVLSHGFMWRRLMHMGCQKNHVYTSVKICYGWPWNTTHLLFPPGRNLSTGSYNLKVSATMFYASTLQHLRVAGMPNLEVGKREIQNVVATSHLPRKQGLRLRLLHWRLSSMSIAVRYIPDKFAGAIIWHPNFKKVRILAFKDGAVVCVGAANLVEMEAAYRSILPQLYMNLDTPENLRIEEENLGPVPLAPNKKRAREEAEAEVMTAAKRQCLAPPED